MGICKGIFRRIDDRLICRNVLLYDKSGVVPEAAGFTLKSVLRRAIF